MEPISEFDHPEHHWKWTALELRWISQRIEAEIAAEREECAKTIEAESQDNTRFEYASAIRERSNNKA